MFKVRFVRVLVSLSLFFISAQSEDVHVAKAEPVKCPTGHPLLHNSLSVATQNDLDVNAVYVNYGRPPLKVIRQFTNPIEARELVPDDQLRSFGGNSTVYIVENHHNVNLARCDRLCCSTEAGVLAPERSGGDCIRLAVEEGALCQIVRDGMAVDGSCHLRPKNVHDPSKWMECRTADAEQ